MAGTNEKTNQSAIIAKYTAVEDTSVKKSFELELMELETIVTSLEKGELTLEESMSVYEQGIKLTTSLNHQLKDAKLKVEELKQTNNEN